MNSIIEALRQAHGLDAARYDEPFLAKMVARRMEATARQTLAGYSSLLAQDEPEARALLGTLSVTFSEFFRNPLAFALLEQCVLPKLAARNRAAGAAELRVWSAGCAAGQEAYSLAILLEEMSGARDTGLPYRVFATDISEPSLAAARLGAYDAASVQQVRLRHLRDHFAQEGPVYTVSARLRQRVDVSVYDLLDEHAASPPAGIYGDFDLIVCSNLLFYYRPHVRQLILAKLRRALSPSGYLMTGEAERGIVEQAGGFEAVAPPAAVFCKSPTPLPQFD